MATTYLGNLEVNLELDDMGVLIVSVKNTMNNIQKREYIDTGAYNANIIDTEQEHIVSFNHDFRFGVYARPNLEGSD